MMALSFQKASRKELKARVALLGPAGSGKSYTALRLAFALAGPDGKVAGIDTEHRSLSKYVGEAPDGPRWDFDVMELETFSPDTYVEGIHLAETAGYAVLIIDSLSHAWAGKNGLLEFVDETAKKKAIRTGGSANNFDAWREATPKHNALVEAMLASKLHLIVTMRVKTEYVQEKDERGKTVIRKVGLQPVQRDGLEYEFDVVADMDMDNNLIVSKTRCVPLRGRLFAMPGPDMAAILARWLSEGAPTPEQKPTPEPKRCPPKPAPAQIISNDHTLDLPVIMAQMDAKEPEKDSKEYKLLRDLQGRIFGCIKREAEATTIAVDREQVYKDIKAAWDIDSLHQFPYDLIDAKELWEQAIKAWFAAKLAQWVPA